MISRIVIAVFLFGSVFHIYGFQWPVSDSKIMSTFGESEFNHYAKGITLGGASQEVKPLDAGELVFYYHQGASPLDLPSGLGTFVIYQHNNGIRSLYGHLQNNSINTEKSVVGISDIIGNMGLTGIDPGPMLYLQVIDTEFGKYINPLLSLPLHIDNNKPVIKKVFLFSKDKRILLGPKSVIKSGVFGLSANIRDLIDSAGYYYPVAPFSISLFINGENMANINFEVLKMEDGKMLLQNSEGIVYNELYRSDWEYFLGNFELSPGDVIIEISVKDFAGNEGVKIISLKITE